MKAKEKIKSNPLKLNEMKGYRVRSGYTSEQIADKLSLARNSYYKRENNEVIFTITEYLNFIKATELSLEEALGLINDPIMMKLLSDYKARILEEAKE